MFPARFPPHTAILVHSGCHENHRNLLETNAITRDIEDKIGAIRTLTSIYGVPAPGGKYNAPTEILAIVRAFHKVDGEYDVTHMTTMEFEQWYEQADSLVDPIFPRKSSIAVIYYNTNKASYYENVQENAIAEALIALQLQHNTIVIPEPKSIPRKPHPLPNTSSKHISQQQQPILPSSTARHIHTAQRTLLRITGANKKGSTQSQTQQPTNTQPLHSKPHKQHQQPTHILGHARHRSRR